MFFPLYKGRLETLIADFICKAIITLVATQSSTKAFASYSLLDII